MRSLPMARCATALELIRGRIDPKRKAICRELVVDESQLAVRIEKVETFILQLPLAEQTFYSSQAAFPERNSLLVRVTAEGGLIGWGEGGQYGPAEPVAAVINEVLGPRLVGRAITAPQKVNDEQYSFSRDFGQKGTYIEAISAIDIALWDLWGQKLGQPVCELLGGSVRRQVTAYATGCYYPNTFHDTEALMAELEDEAKGYASAGFSALKIKVGLLSVRADAERLALVRDAIGPDIKILVDANHAYNTQTAIRMARELEKYDVLCFEEPVVPEDRVGYRRVRDATDVPVAGGEAEFTRYGFRDLFLGECVDIAQPDLCCCGGFSEWLKIQALASSFGVKMVPHVWGSGIGLATALHCTRWQRSRRYPTPPTHSLCRTSRWSNMTASTTRYATTCLSRTSCSPTASSRCRKGRVWA